jgi:hypothetical protein
MIATTNFERQLNDFTGGIVCEPLSARDDGCSSRRLADRTIIPQKLHPSKMSVLLLLAIPFRATSHFFLQRTNIDLPRIWRGGQAEQQISERFVMIGWLCSTREG